MPARTFTRIAIDNRQMTFRISRTALRQLAAALAAQAARQGAIPWRDVTLILVDDAGSAPLNRAIMGHAGATDIITQRYLPLPGEPPGLVGELIVNVERAWRVGLRRRNWSPARELALYIAHGCDHLNDAEDGTPAGRRRMRRRELRWLARVEVPDCLKPARTSNERRGRCRSRLCASASRVSASSSSSPAAPRSQRP